MERRLKILLFLYSTFSIQHSAFAQSWLWDSYGIGDAYTWSAAADKNGNCYIAGIIPSDTLQFGKYLLIDTALGLKLADMEAFIAKVSPNGKILWANHTRNRGSLYSNWSATVVAVDGEENSYLSSNFNDSLFVGADTLVNKIGFSSICLAKYSSSGSVKWLREPYNKNGGGDVLANWISCDNFGDIYMTGAFWDTVIFGSSQLYGAFNDSSGNANVFLSKYDSNGNVKWARQSSGKNPDMTSYGIANDKDGNVYITGEFAGSNTFGSYTINFNGTAFTDFFLTKYDSSGRVSWAKQATAIRNNPYGGGSYGQAVTTDRAGNVYATGSFVDTVIFGKDTLIGNSSKDISFFIVKYNSVGDEIWAKGATVLDSNNWAGWSLSSDNENHIYLSAKGGYHYCKVEFGGATLSLHDTTNNDYASVIYEIDTDGKLLCSAILPVSGGNSNAIASDTSGKYIYFAGSAATVVIFGKDTIDPYSYPINKIEGYNFFPFAARWEACDSNLFTASNELRIINDEVVLYPNPNNGKFIIQAKSEKVIGKSEIEIYNVYGQQVYLSSLYIQNSAFSINLQGQPSGVYFYRMNAEDGNLVGKGKFIIVN